MASVPPAAPPPSEDWAASAADTVERIVGQIRERTTRPAVVAARTVAYGLIAFILAITGFVWILVVVIRVLTYLPQGDWLAYVITGGILTLAGLLLFSMGRRRARTVVV
jgi:hypothetical protein